jgi:hypothetical protein
VCCDVQPLPSGVVPFLQQLDPGYYFLMQDSHLAPRLIVRLDHFLSDLLT